MDPENVIKEAPGNVVEQTSGRRREMTTLVGAVAALLVGLGAGWLAFSPDPPDDVDREIQALVDDYVAAWNAHDGEAVVALMTSDGMHYSGGAALGKEAASDSPAHSLAYFVEHHGAMVATIESVGGPVLRTQDGPPYIVANVLEMTNQASESSQTVEVYKIVPEDGALRIQIHSALVQGIE